MKIKNSLILIVLINFTACKGPVVRTTSSATVTSSATSSSQNSIPLPTPVDIHYRQFEPSKLEGYALEGFDVEVAYNIDLSTIVVAYSDGDLENSSSPTNWGDRLLLIKGDSIHFQSKPVGDPYQYEPNFFRNTINNKVVVICQLGNEDHYGGEAFILDGGEIEFMGEIEMESPFDTAENNSLIDIVRISEKGNSIYFKFTSDSLVFVGNDDWLHFTNDSVQYKNQELKLIGMQLF